MSATEETLKQQIRNDTLSLVYVLYGEESYLTEHYVRQLADQVTGGEDMGGFNRVELDGQECGMDAIEDAVTSLPLMAERKCVLVRELDVPAAAYFDRMLAILADPSPDCVLILWYHGPIETGKNAKWRQFLAAADKAGTCVEFARRSENEIARMLLSGAARRGCILRQDTAALMIEQCGNDLRVLLNELEKLCAVVGEGGTITSELVAQAATRQLSARVYDLSKYMLRGDYRASYTALDRLLAAREEPVTVLAVLSGAYIDLYRAKVAASAGVPADSLAADFGYRGREFVLRNAARDCGRLDMTTLRRCLAVLAEADGRLKGSRVSPRVVLEQTVARLIVLGKGGTV